MATQKIARRRSWGTLRTMRNGSIQASYIYDGDGKRYYAIHTYDSKMDAEGWLASERRLIEMESGRHRRVAPSSRRLPGSLCGSMPSSGWSTAT